LFKTLAKSGVFWDDPRIILVMVADNDECLLGTHNCGVARECNNIPGSFRCVPRTCPQGYRLNYQTGDCDPVICPRGRRADDVGNCVGQNWTMFIIIKLPLHSA